MYVKQVSYNSPQASHELSESLHETGFAVVKDHPINYGDIEGLYAAWKTFFNTEKKMDFLFNKKQQDGYVPMDIAETAKGNSIRDIKEFYQYYPWGQCPEELKQMTQAVYDNLHQLAATLLQWIEAETPATIQQQFSMHLKDMIAGTDRSQLRILHYPPMTGNEEPGAVRAAAHEDICLITLLPAATASGLEVKDREGNWHQVISDPGNIIMNVGDMLQECSRGYYPSTTHRVVNPDVANKDLPRMSMPLFLHPHHHVMLSERHTAESYLMERLEEIGVL